MATRSETASLEGETLGSRYQMGDDRYPDASSSHSFQTWFVWPDVEPDAETALSILPTFEPSEIFQKINLV